MSSSSDNSNWICMGGLVFAKIRGFRPWPAKITGIKKNNRFREMCYEVMFYGTYERSSCKSRNLFPYEEYKLMYGTRTKRDCFKLALNEIEKTPEIISSSGELLLKMDDDSNGDETMPCIAGLDKNANALTSRVSPGTSVGRNIKTRANGKRGVRKNRRCNAGSPRKYNLRMRAYADPGKRSGKISTYLALKGGGMTERDNRAAKRQALKDEQE